MRGLLLGGLLGMLFGGGLGGMAGLFGLIVQLGLIFLVIRLVMGVCDRMTIMRDGRVVWTGWLLMLGLGVVGGIVGAATDQLPALLYVAEALNYAITLALATALFAVIFRYFPDADIEWRDVWFGAFVTSLLLLVGKFLLGLYISSGSLASTYGAAASIIIFLVWVYYSMQIVLIGAEFTQVWAGEHGRKIVADEGGGLGGHAQPA